MVEHATPNKYPFKELVTGRRVIRVGVSQWNAVQAVLQEASMGAAAINTFSQDSDRHLKWRFKEHNSNFPQWESEQAAAQVSDRIFNATMALNQVVARGEELLGVPELKIRDIKGSYELTPDENHAMKTTEVFDDQHELVAIEVELKEKKPRKTPRTPQFDCI